MSLLNPAVQPAYGFEPNVVDVKCVAGAAIAQYGLCFFDFTATTKTPGATDSIYAKVQPTGTTCQTYGLYGVAQQAATAAGQIITVRVVGPTLVLGKASSSWVAGEYAMVPKTSATAQKVEVYADNVTARAFIGMVNTTETAVNPTIVLDGTFKGVTFVKET